MQNNIFLRVAARLAIAAVIALIGAVLWALEPGTGISGALTFQLLCLATIALAVLAGTVLSIGVVVAVGLSLRSPGSKKVMVVLLCVGAALLTSPVFAQEAVPSPPGFSLADLVPPPSDTSMRWLRHLFAPAMSDGDGVISDMGTMFGDMLTTFNFCILIAASFLLTYNFGVGIMQTANDGEFLGRHWSGLWAPVRIASVFVFLLPAANGFTLGQVGALKIAELGIGMGNQIWRVAASKLAQASPMIQIEIPVALRYAREAFYSQVCASYLNMHETQVRERPFTAVQIYSRTDTASGDIIVSFDGEPGTVYGPAVCGRFSLPLNGAADGIEAISPIDAPAAANTLFQRQAAAATWLLNRLNEIAFEMVSSYPIYTNPDLKSASATLTNYQTRLLSAAADAQATLKSTDLVALKTQMDRDGWVGAGKYWMSIARINSATATAAQNVPSRTIEPDWAHIAAVTDTRMTGSLLAHADMWWSQLAPSLDQKPNQSRLLNLVDPTRRNGQQSFPAFLGFIESGQFLLNAGLIAIGGAVVIDSASSIASMLSKFTPTGRLAAIISKVGQSSTKAEDNSIATSWAARLGSVTRMIWLIAVPLVIVGFVLGYLLPVYPFFSFLTAAVSWFILVVVSVIAAPLWALAHLRMDGHEFATESSKMGYLLLFKVLLTPTLLLFGLVTSFYAFELFARYLSENFAGTLQQIHGGDTSWSNIGYALIYMAGLLVIASQSMRLISLLPDKVLMWLSPHSSGGSNSEWTAAITGAVAGAAVAGARTASGTAGHAATAIKATLPKRTGRAGPTGGGGAA